MIVENVKQGTEAWMQLRVGIPTASGFDKIVTTKGDRTKQYQKYLWTLAGERLIGNKEESYQNAAMQRGILMESEARSFYEFTYGVTVEEVGICFQDKSRKWAASPDGLLGKDGCLEIKCPMLPTMVGYMLEGNLAMDYKQQLQGQLLVTGRDWVDILAYYPGLNPIVVRVERDKPFLKALEAELQLFCRELSITEAKLRGEK